MILCTAGLLQGIYLNCCLTRENLVDFTTIEQILKDNYNANWVEYNGGLYIKFNNPRMESLFKLKYSEYL